MKELSFENYLLYKSNESDYKKSLFESIFKNYIFDLIDLYYIKDKKEHKVNTSGLIERIYDCILFAKANGANISYVSVIGEIHPLDGRYIDFIIKKSINEKTKELTNITISTKKLKTDSTNKIKDTLKYELGIFFIELDKYWDKIIRNIEKEKDEVKKIKNIMEYTQSVTEIYFKIINKKHFKIAAQKSAEARKDIIRYAEMLWRKNGCIRTMQEAKRLEMKLLNKYIFRDSETIFGWICEWRKK